MARWQRGAACLSVRGAARLRLLFHHPLAGFLLQRIAHLQSLAGVGSLGAECNRGIRFGALEGNRGHVHIHGPDVDLAGNGIDHTLTNGFLAFAGAIAAGQDTTQEGDDCEEFHGSIIPLERIASIRPASSNREASTVTWMPSFLAVADVTGPIDATGIPAIVSAPTAADRFSTVEELVK